MATFLLEIGTEELPADFVRQALPQLEERARQDLATARLSPGRLEAVGTPRRLALIVHDLPPCQGDLREERKGPPAGQAFHDGQPTQAAIGFARRCGIDPSLLEIRQTAKGAFAFATVTEPGLATAEVLAGLVPGWITGLQGRRFMRWGTGEQRFSRPIRWLVALLDDSVVPLEIGDCDPPLASGRCSRGHRLQPGPVTIQAAGDYGASLAAAGVQVDRAGRGHWIRGRVTAAAAAHQATADLPEPLFEELVDLVEAPQLVEGCFEERFLALPAEVLSTVMRVHQRYVPLVRADARVDPLAMEATGVLLPRFLCIGNGRPEAAPTIQRGNERVLRARLADAEFFVRADRAVPSIDRREALARVTFAEGLGSLRDRVERLEWLTDGLLELLCLDPATADHARRAAHLCKHDLVSQMVGEFPELQGVMGGKYLLAEGEPREVAQAVLEHYQPRGAGDALPASDAGALLALAERLELLLSIFAKGERPSGSSDPYALRRAGNGVLQILWDRGWSLNLERLLSRAAGQWATQLGAFAVQSDGLAADLGEFLRQRMLSLLEEEGIDPDLAQAVAGDTVELARVLADPADGRLRAGLLAELRADGRLAAVQAVVQRAARLAVHAQLPATVLAPAEAVRPELFDKPSEAAMLAVLQRLEPIAAGSGSDRYGALAAGLSASAATLAAFFDGDQSVMVMAEDPQVRTNRLHLLAVLCNQASVLADFSRLAG